MLIRHLSTTGSTNDDALAWAQDGAPHGAVVRADFQTQGRGRAGRSWESPEGLGLYFSLVLRPEIELSQVPQLTMLAALAAARTLEKRTQIPTNVKWPNDVVLRGGKIGGVLSEARALPNSPSRLAFAIVGVGLNINFSRGDLPPRPIFPATSLYIETGKVHSPDEVFAEFLNEMQTLDNQWPGRWHQLREEWLRRDVLQNQTVQVEDAQENWSGTACGIDERGALLVQTKSETRRVVAGDVTLGWEGF